jgi:hypothetical protein
MRVRMRRTTNTTTVTHQMILTRRSAGAGKDIWCAQCGGAIRMVALEDAMRLSTLSSRAIYRLIEEAQIHFTETVDGLVMICPATLLRLA